MESGGATCGASTGSTVGVTTALTGALAGEAGYMAGTALGTTRPRNGHRARLKAKAFQTLTDGLALTPVGETFYVQQRYGTGVYEMLRTPTGHQWVTMQPYSSRLRQATYVPYLVVTSNVGTFLFDIWPADGRIWDGRVVPNRLATSPPTLNLLLDPWNALDEAGTTPAREPNTASTTDPLGGSNAVKYTATAQNQQDTWYRSTYGALPADNYKLAVWAKYLSGAGTAWRIGGISVSFGAIAATGTWTQYTTTLSNFTASVDIGISTAPGNTDGVIAIAGAQVLDSYAGDTPGTLLQELNAQRAGHLKRNLSGVGTFSINTDGTFTIDGTSGAGLVTVDPTGIDLSAGFTFGGWFDATQLPSDAQGLAFGFDNHSGLTNGANGATHGQFGIYGNNGTLTAANSYRLGKPYCNPNVSQLASSPAPNHYLINQGPKFIAMSLVPNGDGTATQTLYINEVPFVMTRSMSMPTIAVARMLLAAWNNTTERHKTANAWIGKVGNLFFSTPALSQSQIHQRGKYMREQLHMAGGVPAVRKAMFIANGDSLSAFTPSYIWHLSDRTDFSPRLDLCNTAIGGTKIYDALTDPRHADFLAQVQAAITAGYEKVVILGRWATNETLTGQPGSWIDGKYTIWRDTYYRPFVAAAKALGPGVVEWWHVTQGSSTDLNNGANSPSAAWTVEQLYLTFNDDFRANYVAYGIDRIVDIGLGTERMTGPGTFAAETIPGGRTMANWRCNNAAKASPIIGSASRSPGGTLTLSAASGSAITATASLGAGTFLYHDLYRKIVAGAAGYGRIIAISANGSQATLDTTDNAPTAWAGESALTLARDTVLRGGGYDTTSYASWSIQNCAEEWLNDGTHQAQRGGRNECDYVASTIQAFLDGLAGNV